MTRLRFFFLVGGIFILLVFGTLWRERAEIAACRAEGGFWGQAGAVCLR